MDHNHTWSTQEETVKKYDITEMPVRANCLYDLNDKLGYLNSVQNKAQAINYGYPDSSTIQKHTLEYYWVITEMDGFIINLLEEVIDLKIEENT